MDIRAEYWGNAHPIIYRTKRKHFAIWGTFNNGKVSRNFDTGGKIIGKWTTATEMEKGNGGEISKTMPKRQPIRYKYLFLPKKGVGGTSIPGPTAAQLANEKLTILRFQSNVETR